LAIYYRNNMLDRLVKVWTYLVTSIAVCIYFYVLPCDNKLYE
jgi:hypothetical protein